MYKILFVILLALFITFASGAYGANLEHGKKLHDAHCTACHIGMTGGDGSVIYTRKNRRVKTLESLENQVRRCEISQQLKWFDEDVNNVVQYLNDSYYKFD